MPKRATTETDEPPRRSKRTTVSASAPTSRKPPLKPTMKPTTKPSPSPEKAKLVVPTKPVPRVKRPTPQPTRPLDVRLSGELLVYGMNEAGQIGLDDPGKEKRYPFKLEAMQEYTGSQHIAKIACGGLHSAAVTVDGKVYTWGCNDEGALGAGKKAEGEEDDDWKPKQTKGVTEKVVDVSAGDSHTAFLTEFGQVYLTGTMRDPNGAFGLNPRSADSYTFLPFVLVEPKPRDSEVFRDTAVKISSGHNHFAYLNDKNEIYLLGDVSSGQLGHIPRYKAEGGRVGKSYFLRRRRAFVKHGRKFLKFDNVCCTPFGTFVHEKDRDAWWACGNNQRHQLGFPKSIALDEEDNEELSKGIVSEWMEVENLRDKKVIKIVGTMIDTIALTSDGALFVFGAKEFLGIKQDDSPAPTGDTDYPILHPTFNGQERSVRDVAISSNNSVIVVTAEGEMFVWGSSASSLLTTDPDDDDVDILSAPMKVESKNTKEFEIVQVAAGASHALLIGRRRPENFGSSGVQ